MREQERLEDCRSNFADMAKLTLNRMQRRVIMWYVIQTLTGKEEELVRMIKGIVPTELYRDCFVIYYERFWRKQQQSIIHVERLFPGYVFIDTEQPKSIFMHLKKIPVMSQIIRDDEFTFLSVYPDEEDMLKHLLNADDDHVVRLSYVEKTATGNIKRIDGPLCYYQNQVERYQFKKRYAIIRLSLSGKEQSIVLGILLKEDIRQELQSGNVGISRALPTTSDTVTVMQSQRDAKKLSNKSLPEHFPIGSEVMVRSGVLQGMRGVVWRIHASCIEVGIRLLGQDIGVEIDEKELELLD